MIDTNDKNISITFQLTLEDIYFIEKIGVNEIIIIPLKILVPIK